MTSAAVHPLDPLGADELRAAVATLRRERSLNGTARIAKVVLDEPPKRDVLAWQPGAAVRRRARVELVDTATGSAYEGVVDVGTGEVVSFDKIGSGQPPFAFEEFVLAAEVVKCDVRWQEAVRARGVTDLDLVQVDPWSTGSNVPGHLAGRRLARCVSYVREVAVDNGYAHPIEGLMALVDLNAGEVVELVDEGAKPVPPTSGRYDAEAVGGFRTDLRPLEITQAEGPSFTVNGNELRWQRWSLRVSLHQTEGLVLHTVGYEDGGRVRPVLYRASVAEMVVPYGDTAPTHWWKNAFDAGEYGLGAMANSLTLGCDCLGEIRYLDAELLGYGGEPRTITNAICIHEEDVGILWKHQDPAAGTEVRRARRLVISSIATVGNYEYGFYWQLYQDGTISLEVKSTGIMQTAALAEGETPAHGVVVAPGLYAPHHQHFFSVRLDLDVDGPANVVEEVETSGVAMGPDNPEGNAFVTRATPLRSEREARRDTDARASRHWRVVNRSSRNALDQPVGYRLVPSNTTTLLAQPGSSIARRAAFTTSTLWVTQEDATQRHPAGDHPNLGTGENGLPQWQAADRPLEDVDVVLWYTLGITHIARPEDWPVMPAQISGFKLEPVGFFDRNPALDVAPSASSNCH